MARTKLRSDGDQTNHRLTAIRVDRLKPGVYLRQPIYSEDGILLIAAGVEITAATIERLIQRGVTVAWVHRTEIAWISGAGSPKRPALQTVVGTDRKPFLERPPVQGAVAYDPRLHGRVTTSRKVAVAEVGTLFRTCDIVRTGDLQVLEDLTVTSLAQLSEDTDAFVSQEALRQGTEYPAQQAVQSSAVALAIGAKMGLDKRDLASLGVGCLIHDLGMLRINLDAVRQSDSRDPSVWLELMKHPAITFDLMGDVARQAGTARLIAYQMHERLDGSGFPRGREGNQIHPLSRIAAVADAYARLVSSPGANSHTAYEAIVQLLHGAGRGQFDPLAVRGLLQTVALFPIGTPVLLSDGRHGRVLRANGQSYTRPVVEAWAGDHPDDKQLVDLLGNRDLHVLRLLPEPDPTPSPVPASPTPSLISA